MLRHYHGLDLEVKSAAKGAKGAFKCPLSWHARVLTPIFHTRCNCFIPPQFKAPLRVDILVVRTEVQCVLYQRKIEVRTWSMSHLLSSVGSVLYCDTNGPTHAATVLSLASSAASVFASSLGPLRIVRCIVLLRRVAHSFTVCALLQQLRCCSLHSSCYTSCFDLINSGEQCN